MSRSTKFLSGHNSYFHSLYFLSQYLAQNMDVQSRGNSMSAYSKVRQILLIGPYPDPTHGQAVATLAFANFLADSGFEVKRINTAEGSKVGGKLTRVARLISAMGYIIISNRSPVCISVNANLGMIFSIFYCLLSRFFRCPLLLHHHSYRYIGWPSIIANFLIFSAGKNALHITNCDAMSTKLVRRYPKIKKYQSFSNVGLCQDFKICETNSNKIPVIGHISNLTEEKGIELVISSFRKLLSTGRCSKLIVAGPCCDEFSKDIINKAIIEFGEMFIYAGPIYGAEKIAFYHSIDIFIFPSRYSTETQGIVLLEALSAGIPVIAFGQCCIPDDLSNGGGTAVEMDGNFVEAVVDIYDTFRASPMVVSMRARAKFDALYAQHWCERREIVSYFSQLFSYTPTH